MSRLLHSALRAQCPLVGALFALAAVALFFVPLDRALHFRTVAGLEFSGVALLLAMELSIGVPMGLVAGLYRATGRLARAAIIGSCQQLALVGLTLVLIADRTGFVRLAGVRVGIALIVTVWTIRDLRRLYPWLRIWPTSGSWREGIRMIGPSVFFLLIPVADYLSGQFTLLVVQKTLHAGEVSRLATHRTVVNLAQMASGLLTTAIWPELTALYARVQGEHLTRIHRSLTKLNLWLVGGVIFGMLPFLPWIYPSWTAGRLALDRWTLALLVIQKLAWGMWYASMTVLMAINRQQLVALAMLGSAVVTGVLAMVLVPVLGISGAALAALVGDLCVSAWLIPLLASRQIGDNLRGFLAETSVALTRGIGIPVGLGLVAWYLAPFPYVQYFAIFPACAGLAFVLMWRQLASPERQLVIHLLEWGFGSRRSRQAHWR